jgi:D-glycero-alpha-D-manno-heptose-7-phosphate kinase
MILSKTPLRMSFVGGGTDYLTDFKDHGRVITTSINKYLYILLNKKYDHRLRISYSKTENVDNIDQVNHKLIRETLKLFKLKKGLEIVTSADIPSSGSGLGSSSALTVGLVNAIFKFSNKTITKSELAKLACKIEIEQCNKPIGMQDQYATAFGGFNKIEFKKKKIVVKKIKLDKSRLKNFKSKIMMFYTGVNRNADHILQKIKRKKNQFKHYEKLINLVENFEKELLYGDLKNLGPIMHENWMLKKDLSSKVSNLKINEIYEAAINSGANGGKLLGAGGGGYFIFLAEKENQKKIKKNLSKLEYINFDFEEQGSKSFEI